MSHLRTFVANQVLSRIRAFLGVFCPDFYSDIEDFTQILCRYLSKISAAGTSDSTLSGLSVLYRDILRKQYIASFGNIRKYRDIF